MSAEKVLIGISIDLILDAAGSDNVRGRTREEKRETVRAYLESDDAPGIAADALANDLGMSAFDGAGNRIF